MQHAVNPTIHPIIRPGCVWCFFSGDSVLLRFVSARDSIAKNAIVITAKSFTVGGRRTVGSHTASVCLKRMAEDDIAMCFQATSRVVQFLRCDWLSTVLHVRQPSRCRRRTGCPWTRPVRRCCRRWLWCLTFCHSSQDDKESVRIVRNHFP